MSGKTVLVTGGAAGIGAEASRILAREGGAVMVADIQAEAGEGVARGIVEAGGRAVFQRLDVRDEASWAAATDRACAELGGLDVVVNNAGVGVPFGNVEEQTLDEWRTVMSVNSDGVFLGVRQAIRTMRETGARGSIVNISSVAGMVGMTMSCAYSASKGAVRQLTKTAAIYCAKERLPIRVNSIHPGYVETDMFRATMTLNDEQLARMRTLSERIPMGTFAAPEDIANGILFLASEESRYMTGAELVIDGGYAAQ